MRFVLCVVGAFSLWAGCHQKKPADLPANLSAASASPDAANGYARGFNQLSSLCADRIRTYFAAIPRDAAEVGARPVLAPSTAADDKTIDEAAKQFADARAKMQPPLPLLSDKLVAEARKVLVAYRASASAQTAAEVKAAHQRFIAVADGYRAAAFQLEDTLFAAEDQTTIDELPKYAASRRWGYWFRVVEIQAKKSLRAAKRGDSDGQAEVFQTAYNEMVKFVESEPDAPKEARTWLRSADVFFDAVNGVKEGNTAPAQEQLLQAYNQLVAAENTLRTLEAQGTLK